MEKTTSRLARRGMLAVLVALSCWSQSPAIEGLSQTPELKMTADDLVSGAFQGRMLTFVLDTGTTRSFIDIRVARASGAKLRDTISVSGVGPALQQARLLTMPLAIVATLGSPHDRVVVEGVFPNSPAAEAGFEPGDEIIEVNGERLAPLALVDLRSRLRQPEGTEIKITARRRNMRGVLTLVLRRLVEP